MVYLSNLEPITETKVRVTSVHYMPFDEVNGLGMTEEELELSGMLVDSIPSAVIPKGQRKTGMFINPQTKEVWYEYETIPPTKEELLQAQVDELTIAMAALIGGAQ